jgi:hypothetical protein
MRYRILSALNLTTWGKYFPVGGTQIGRDVTPAMPLIKKNETEQSLLYNGLQVLTHSGLHWHIYCNSIEM